MLRHPDRLLAPCVCVLQTVGIAAWCSCYAVIIYGPNSASFFDMDIDYMQGVTFSLAAWGVVSTTFQISRWVKLNDLDSGRRAVKDVVKDMEKKGAIDADDKVVVDGHVKVLQNVGVDIDIFMSLIFLNEDTHSRTIVFCASVVALRAGRRTLSPALHSPCLGSARLPDA